MTALIIAAGNGFEKSVKKLIRLGASLWKSSILSSSPLSIYSEDSDVSDESDS
jgi:hypothetical protein